MKRPHVMRLRVALEKLFWAALLLGSLGLATTRAAREPRVLNLGNVNPSLGCGGTSSGTGDGWGGSSWMPPFPPPGPAQCLCCS